MKILILSDLHLKATNDFDNIPITDETAKVLNDFKISTEKTGIEVWYLITK